MSSAPPLMVRLLAFGLSLGVGFVAAVAGVLTAFLIVIAGVAMVVGIYFVVTGTPFPRWAYRGLPEGRSNRPEGAGLVLMGIGTPGFIIADSALHWLLLGLWFAGAVVICVWASRVTRLV